MFPNVAWTTVAIALTWVVLLAACGISDGATPTPSRTSAEASSPGRTITLGDVEPDEPVKKIRRFQPLADYLAEHLTELGIESGRVILSRDFEEMAGLLSDGTVDIYFDSAFPTLTVQELSGFTVIARRWKEGDPIYWSLYIARRDSGITGLDGFLGKVVAFEKPHSTSGFILPAGTLIQRGFTLREVGQPDEDVAPDEIGYIFTRDEENTVEMLLQGLLAGGGISNQDYEGLPEEIKRQFVVFGRTAAVPRQLVSVRPGLDPELVTRVRELLTGLDETEEGRKLLEGLKKTKKFDELPADSEASLEELKELMGLIFGG